MKPLVFCIDVGTAGRLFLGPGEWFGCLVVCCDESIDVLLQLLAVPLVVVALAGQGASVRRLQIALHPLKAWIEGFSSTHRTMALAGGST